MTTSGFVYDREGNFPIIWRSDKVRSAKNCWSLPSGWHECGYTLIEQFAIETQEELGLDPVVETGERIGIYENIAVVDNWHWCIALVTMHVKSLDNITNKEPDKHPKIERMRLATLLDDTVINSMDWAPGLKEAILEYRLKVYESIYNNIKRLRK